MIKWIFWDLDGTLTDPAEGITKSVAFALKRYGIEVPDRSVLHPFIGPPLTASFEKYYGFSHEQAVEAVEEYRKYYAVTGIFENRLYEGIPKVLSALEEMGIKQVLATSKPTVFAGQILEHFGIHRFFTHVIGSELDGTRVEKADVVRSALKISGALPEEVLMVGDTLFDVEGAAANGIRTVAVSYGYGAPSSLANAYRTAATTEELLTLLTGEITCER